MNSRKVLLFLKYWSIGGMALAISMAIWEVAKSSFLFAAINVTCCGINHFWYNFAKKELKMNRNEKN